MQKESGKRESPYKGILRFAKEKKSQLSFAVVLSVLSSAFGVVPDVYKRQAGGQGQRDRPFPGALHHWLFGHLWPGKHRGFEQALCGV